MSGYDQQKLISGLRLLPLMEKWAELSNFHFLCPPATFVLLEFAGIHIREQNKAGCRNILWASWHGRTAVLSSKCSAVSAGEEAAGLLRTAPIFSELRASPPTMEGSASTSGGSAAGETQVDRTVLQTSKPLHRFVQRQPKILGVTDSGRWVRRYRMVLVSSTVPLPHQTVIVIFACAEFLMGSQLIKESWSPFATYVPFWQGLLVQYK